MIPFIPNPAEKVVVLTMITTTFGWDVSQKERTAPQHTRFILPPFHPDKILRLYCVDGIFLFRT